MTQNVVSGAFSYANYGYEATYGTVAGTEAQIVRPFGHDLKLSVSRKNNMERIFGVGARNAAANIAKKFEGTATVEFLLDAEANIFRAIMGAVPSAGGVGPYTHTFAESNTLASFSICNAVELGSNDYVSILIGCKVQSAEFSFAVDEPCRVRLECPWRTESIAATGIGAAHAPTESPLTFAYGTIQVNNTTVGYIQSGTLTITNNVEMVWGVGSRYSTAGPEKTRTYDLKMSVAFSDVTLLLEKFLGTTVPMAATALSTLNPAGVALTLVFDNGLATTNSRIVAFTFANFYINEHTLPLDVNDVIKEDVTGYALSCTSVVVTNNTANDTANP